MTKRQLPCVEVPSTTMESSEEGLSNLRGGFRTRRQAFRALHERGRFVIPNP